MSFDHYILASDLNRITTKFNLSYFVDEVPYFPNFRIRSGEMSYVLRNYQTKEILQHHFGLSLPNHHENIPFVRAEGTRNTEDNPRYTGSKAIFLNPDYNKLIRLQRCLVLADAFVVGSELQMPHVVYLRGKNRPFAFAGIYTPEPESFSIITTVANQLLQKLGQKRMPVILFPDYEHSWLRTSSPLSEILSMLTPYPANMMNAYPISMKANDLAINDKSLIQPIGKPIYEEKISYKTMSRLGRKESNTTKAHYTLEERVRMSKSDDA